MNERSEGRDRRVKIVEGSFRCDGCSRWHGNGVKTEYGFCLRCIERQRRWWLERMALEECHAIAALIWPRERREEPTLAA